MQGLVAGAAARDQAHLAGLWAVGPGDHLVLDVDGQRRVGRGDPGERVGHHGVGRVDELLHDVPSGTLSVLGTGSAGARLVNDASARTRPMPAQARPPRTPPARSPMR